MRIFYQEKIYDYKTVKEAERHANKMKETGWYIKDKLYDNGGTTEKWSICYMKGAV